MLLSGSLAPLEMPAVDTATLAVAAETAAQVTAPEPPAPADPDTSAAPVGPATPPPSSAEPSASSPPGTARGPATAEQEPLVVVGRSRRGDPLAEANAESFGITQEVDEALVGPIARAYKDGLPRPVRSGIRNFLNNLREPIVAVNFLLQLKPGKAVETVGRFAINSTVGVAGLVDVAKRRPVNAPRRRNGFANTLGYYGVKPGPFLYLPLIGATTVRDLIGNTVDQAFSPIAMVKPFNRIEFVLPLATLSAIDSRAEFDEELEALRATRDPYAATRKFYLDRRQAEIDALRGRPFVMPVPGEGALPAEPAPEPPR